jgi:hypothetical protein
MTDAPYRDWGNIESLKQSFCPRQTYRLSSIPDAFSTSGLLRESRSGRTWVGLSPISDP